MPSGVGRAHATTPTWRVARARGSGRGRDFLLMRAAPVARRGWATLPSRRRPRAMSGCLSSRARFARRRANKKSGERAMSHLLHAHHIRNSQDLHRRAEFTSLGSSGMGRPKGALAKPYRLDQSSKNPSPETPFLTTVEGYSPTRSMPLTRAAAPSSWPSRGARRATTPQRAAPWRARTSGGPRPARGIGEGRRLLRGRARGAPEDMHTLALRCVRRRRRRPPPTHVPPPQATLHAMPSANPYGNVTSDPGTGRSASSADAPADTATAGIIGFDAALLAAHHIGTRSTTHPQPGRAHSTHTAHHNSADVVPPRTRTVTVAHLQRLRQGAWQEAGPSTTAGGAVLDECCGGSNLTSVASFLRRSVGRVCAPHVGR